MTDKNRNIKFKGVFTAIITPFNADESIDFDSLKKLIDDNIENGVAGIVPCGTTGESPTLDENEHSKVIETTIKHVNGRVLVIAGTGSNCTKEAIARSVHAEKLGANALLLVNPYYNKPTQEGLYRHFKAIANSVKIPCIVYNIKGRTGVNVETSTLMRLINDCSNIIAVKEASGDIDQIKDVIANAPDYFSVLSGDDNITLQLIKEGGHGVISVISNFIPKQMSEMVDYALNGNYESAEKINNQISELFVMEFVETNPIPVKYMLSQKGFCKEVYRLPMCELSDANKIKVKEAIKNYV
ncbi:MAG: 4-hydroxy-tetrahydrodipicolinate synthase [Candidatus Woesearchaeota archaeon]